MKPVKDNIKKKNSVLEQWMSRKKNQPTTKGIQPAPSDVSIPLTYGQKRIWLLQNLYPDNPFYHYTHIYHFDGKLDIKALEQAFALLLKRHTILRTTFENTGQDIIQKINPVLTLPVSKLDLMHLPVDQRDDEVTRLAIIEAKSPFDLRKGPLIRVNIFQIEETEQIMTLTLHHIIGDQWSLKLLHDELVAAYQSYLKDEVPKLAPLPVQYSDYAYWQRNRSVKSNHLDYWKKQLAGDLPVLNLPVDFIRPNIPTYEGAQLSKTYPKSLSKNIRSLSKANETTVYVTLLAAFNVLLNRYTGQTDILIGTPHSNRDQTSLERLIGFFNETVVLRSNLEADPAFTALLDQVKKTTLEALQYKDVPFERLVEELKPDRESSVNPLFQAMFIYNETPESPDFGDELTVKEYTLDLGVSKFDLTLFIKDDGHQLTSTFEYSGDLFKAATIERIHQHFEQLLQSIVGQPKQNISRLDILAPPERQQILEEWNATKVEIPLYQNICQRIEEKAKNSPDQVALVFEDQSITYEELNEQANTIAKFLQHQGIQTNDLVGLLTRRSPDMLIGIVGILKSGGAYLPLDPEYPRERIDFVLEDARVPIVLTQEDLIGLVEKNKVEKVCISTILPSDEYKNHLLNEVAQEQNLAYMIYTSGSSGQPKGVQISHRNLLYSTMARFEFYHRQPKAFLLLSSFAFDSSVVGIFWTLCNGGTLVLPKKRIEQDLEGLADIILKNNVTHTLLLPSLYNVLLENIELKKLNSLNTVMVAGEACSASLVDLHFKSLPEADLYNEYGPTEATVWSTAYQMTASDAKGAIPIGRPIPNVTNYILDKNLEPVPVGVAGELYIGGEGVAGQYWNRPELSNKKFIPSPFSSKQDAKLYRTGDLAKYRDNGLIDYLGRADQQVKIRGYRIELDEIEKVIKQIGAISEAVVLVKSGEQSERKRLIAYVTGQNGDNLPVTIREYLKSRLPGYMVPEAIQQIDEFPRLPNGKIDTQSLPDPADSSSPRNEATAGAARTDTEAKLVAIWKDVLEVDSVGIYDNFFDIGGNSILSIQITAKIGKAGFATTPNQLFNHQTIATLAPTLSVKETKIVEQNPAEDSEEKIAALSTLQQAFLFQSLQGDADPGFLQLQFTLNGELDINLFKKAWAYAVEYHSVLRTRIDYQDLHTAIQVVEPRAELPWVTEDWSTLDNTQQAEKLEAYKAKNNQLELNKAPVSRMAFFQTAVDRHWLIWSVHHILLDGWSGGIILRDVLDFYQKIQANEPVVLPKLPSYSSYLRWVKNQDEQKARAFWQETFADPGEPALIPPTDALQKSNFSDYAFQLTGELSTTLRQTAKKQRITLPVLLQGVFSLVLCKYLDKKDVIIGMTVSGRFSSFPDLEKMAGLFMNVLPARASIREKEELWKWLKKVQQHQLDMLKYEYNGLGQISEWIDWPEHLDLFNSLFVFGNFLKDGLKVGDIAVDAFSGDFSSTYPLTLRVNPLNELEFDFRFDENYLSEKHIEWFRQQIMLILGLIAIEDELSLGELLNKVSASPLSTREAEDQPDLPAADVGEKKSTVYQEAENETEFLLTRLWEEVLGRRSIGITDNFFDMGGRSIHSLRIFSKLQKQLKVNLSPVTLVQYPTIQSLSKYLRKEIATSDWTSLVALKSGGKKRPLFCMHAGGAHVLFYKPLADRLDKDRPVYALQARGLDGHGKQHQTIAEMAADYIKEIQSVQPVGPYALLGTCFGNAVSLEMANQLIAKGEKIALLAIIDSAPAHLVSVEFFNKKQPFINFLKMLTSGNWGGILNGISSRIFRAKNKVKSSFESEQEKNLRETILYLNNLYRTYLWESFSGEVLLIRSEEFNSLKRKDFHIEQWEILAEKGVQVHVIPGRHLTIFAEPEVEEMAKIVEANLQNT